MSEASAKKNVKKSGSAPAAETPEVRPPMPPPPPKSDAEDDEGAIRISENVITAVVRKYVLEVKGVIRFASSSLVGGLAEMIGRKSRESSVAVELDGDSVDISVTLILEFGVKIPEVAALVQDVIRTRVEEITGKHVGKVNVIVQDLEELPPPEEETATVETKPETADEEQASGE